VRLSLVESCSKENWGLQVVTNGCDLSFGTTCNELIYPGLSFTERGQSFLRISSNLDILATADLYYDPKDFEFEGSAYLEFELGDYTVGPYAPPGLSLDLLVNQPMNQVEGHEIAYPGNYS